MTALKMSHVLEIQGLVTVSKISRLAWGRSSTATSRPARLPVYPTATSNTPANPRHPWSTYMSGQGGRDCHSSRPYGVSNGAFNRFSVL
eukprot:SAG25_NODE_1670_length_2575_cov_14.307351_3_plen_89_part_00